MTLTYDAVLDYLLDQSRDSDCYDAADQEDLQSCFQCSNCPSEALHRLVAIQSLRIYYFGECVYPIKIEINYGIIRMERNQNKMKNSVIINIIYFYLRFLVPVHQD